MTKELIIKVKFIEFANSFMENGISTKGIVANYKMINYLCNTNPDNEKCINFISIYIQHMEDLLY